MMPSTRSAPNTRRCLPPPQSAHEKWCNRDLSYMSSIAEIMSALLAQRSDALLQGGRRESLHDPARGLCLHHHHLAKDLPLASLRGGLRPGLQPDQAWDGEQARLPNLRRRDLGQAVNGLRAHRLLQLTRSCKRVSNGPH